MLFFSAFYHFLSLFCFSFLFSFVVSDRFSFLIVFSLFSFVVLLFVIFPILLTRCCHGDHSHLLFSVV